jgi:hypothetical protein
MKKYIFIIALVILIIGSILILTKKKPSPGIEDVSATIIDSTVSTSSNNQEDTSTIVSTIPIPSTNTAAPNPTPTPAPVPTPVPNPTPVPEPTPNGYTLAQVAQHNRLAPQQTI